MKRGPNQSPSLEQIPHKKQKTNAGTMLRYAVERGDINHLQTLLSRGVDIKGVDSDGWSLLMIACQRGDTAMVKLLLEHDASNINFQNTNQESALILAARDGKADAVSALLNKGANTNLVDVLGMSALMYACRQGYAGIVKVLLEYGADDITNQVMNMGKILSVAAFRGHTEIVKILLERWEHTPNALKIINYVNKDVRSALLYACIHGHTEIAKMLLAYRADITQRDKDNKSSFMWACAKGHIDIVAFLLAYDANVINDVDGKGASPLLRASQEGHANVVKTLLAYGADLKQQDASGNLALMYACGQGHADVVNILLAYEPNLILGQNNNSFSALMIASRFGRASIVRTMLEQAKLVKDFDINQTDDNGFSALMWACASGHTEITQMLLSYRADINQQDNRDRTAFMLACENGHINTAMFLVAQYPGIIHQTNNQGTSALMFAVKKGQTAMVKALLEKGANINQLDMWGCSPLIHACQEHEEIVKLLLAYGANAKLANKQGNTALMFACINGGVGTIKALLEQGTMNLDQTNNAGFTALGFAVRDNFAGSDNAVVVEMIEDAIKLSTFIEAIMGAYKAQLPWENQRALTECGLNVAKEQLFKHLYQRLSVIKEIHSDKQQSKTFAHLIAQYLAKEQCCITPTSFDVLFSENVNKKVAIFTTQFARVQSTKEKIKTKNKKRNAPASLTGQPRLKKPKVSDDINVAFIDAVRKNDIEQVVAFIDQGMDLNSTELGGVTVLMTASQNGCAELVEILLESGADINQIDSINGYSALLYACENNHIDIVKMLLRSGANVNQTDQYHFTPLMLACQENQLAMASLLLAHGADINKENSKDEHQSALVYACEFANIGLIKLLLDSGANIFRDAQKALFKAIIRQDIELHNIVIILNEAIQVAEFINNIVEAYQAQLPFQRQCTLTEQALNEMKERLFKDLYQKLPLLKEALSNFEHRQELIAIFARHLVIGNGYIKAEKRDYLLRHNNKSFLLGMMVASEESFMPQELVQQLLNTLSNPLLAHCDVDASQESVALYTIGFNMAARKREDNMPASDVKLRNRFFV